MSEDKGYHWGLIAPWDPSNYTNPGQFAGMEARRAADAKFAAGMSGGAAPPGVPGQAGGPGASAPVAPVVGWILLGLAAVVVLAILVLNQVERAQKSVAKQRAAVSAQRMSVLEERMEAALDAELEKIGDGGSERAIFQFIAQSACHRNTAGGHFENRTTVLHCNARRGRIEGYIGYSHFKVDMREKRPFRGESMEVRTQIAVYPFSAHNLASLRSGISGLDAEERRFFADSVATLRKRGFGRSLKRADCALTGTQRRASAPYGEQGDLATAYARREFPVRLGCLGPKGFRYVA